MLGLDKVDKKLEILAFAGACAAALSQFISLIMGFSYGNYLVWNSYLYEEKFNFLCFLPSFFEFLAYAAFALALAFGLLKALSAKKTLFKNLWFVPAAVLLFARIIFVICYAIYDYDWYGAYGMSFFGVVWTVFELVGMCTGGILVLNPGILPASAQQAYAQPDGSYAAPADMHSRARRLTVPRPRRRHASIMHSRRNRTVIAICLSMYCSCFSLLVSGSLFGFTEPRSS